ncbi:hypothetical protein F4809DRAFT_638593 [Biscogniauxia mediterranea]|nr:hypothetical protein F4809DRAFT_638593 [Biscogniauxia mediterranea]
MACSPPVYGLGVGSHGGRRRRRGTFGVEPKIPLAFANIHLPPNTTADTALAWIQLLAGCEVSRCNTLYGGNQVVA